ncbi:unknown [Alistipes sp. CAG:831]|nr:unknown [Alistipes sp. CAG:831]
METAIALKCCPFLQLFRYKSPHLRNQTQQGQIKVSVFHHIEIGACAHSSPINFYVPDTAVGKEAQDILAEKKYSGIGKGILSVAFHDELSGNALFIFKLANLLYSEFPALITDAEKNLILSGSDDFVYGRSDMQQNEPVSLPRIIDNINELVLVFRHRKAAVFREI